MTDIENLEKLEALANSRYEEINSAQSMVDNYNLDVGGIVIDIEKTSISDESSHMVDNTQNLVEEMNSSQSAFNESHHFIDNSSEFINSVANYSAKNESPTMNAGGVTVNLNAYNEIHSSGGDVDSMMKNFGEKIAEAVALAAEGVRL